MPAHVEPVSACRQIQPSLPKGKTVQLQNSPTANQVPHDKAARRGGLGATEQTATEAPSAGNGCTCLQVRAAPSVQPAQGSTGRKMISGGRQPVPTARKMGAGTGTVSNSIPGAELRAQRLPNHNHDRVLGQPRGAPQLPVELRALVGAAAAPLWPTGSLGSAPGPPVPSLVTAPAVLQPRVHLHGLAFQRRGAPSKQHTGSSARGSFLFPRRARRGRCRLPNECPTVQAGARPLTSPVTATQLHRGREEFQQNSVYPTGHGVRPLTQAPGRPERRRTPRHCSFWLDLRLQICCFYFMLCGSLAEAQKTLTTH